MMKYLKQILLAATFLALSTLSITAQEKYRGGLKPNVNEKNNLPIQSNGYALVVATDEYENFDDLNNPIYDAKGVAEVLRSDYNFEVEVLTSPTKRDLMETIIEYHDNKLRPNDRFLLYLAGHGDYDDSYYEEGFLVLKDSKLRKDDPGLLSYVPFHSLKSLTENLPAQQVLVVVDVCFGGSFNDKINKGRAVYNNQYTVTAEDFLRFQLKEKNRYVLSSGRLEVVSDGQNGKHSPFAGAFIHSLKEHKMDSIVTAETVKYDLKTLPSHPILGSFSESVGNTEFVFRSKSNVTELGSLVKRAIDKYYAYQMNLSKYKYEDPFLKESAELKDIESILNNAAVEEENAEAMFWLLIMNLQKDHVELSGGEVDYYAKIVAGKFQEEVDNGNDEHLWHLAALQSLGIKKVSDDEDIITLFYEAMGKGQIESFYFAGKFALENGYKNRAYSAFAKGAKRNDPFCQYELGKLKYENRNTYELDKSIEGYIEDLTKASEAGLQRATDLLMTLD